LRIEVDQQDTALGSRQRRREIDGGGRLADPTFLICDSDDPIHIDFSILGTAG
jgi:hypothetical protein